MGTFQLSKHQRGSYTQVSLGNWQTYWKLLDVPKVRLTSFKLKSRKVVHLESYSFERGHSEDSFHGSLHPWKSQIRVAEKSKWIATLTDSWLSWRQWALSRVSWRSSFKWGQKYISRSNNFHYIYIYRPQRSVCTVCVVWVCVCVRVCLSGHGRPNCSTDHKHTWSANTASHKLS